MPFETRPSETPQCFDLYEGEGRIGEVVYAPAEDGFPEAWDVRMWNVADSSQAWSDSADTVEDVAELTQIFYQELVEARRGEVSRSVSAISTPMGGQRRR